MCVKPHLYRCLSLFSFMFACVCWRLCGGVCVSNCDTSLEEGCRHFRAPVRPADKLRKASTPRIDDSSSQEQRRLAVERKCSSAGVHYWEMHTHVHHLQYMDKSMWTTRCQSKIMGCSILLSGKALHKTWKPGVVVNTDSKVVHPKRSWLGMLRSE